MRVRSGSTARITTRPPDSTSWSLRARQSSPTTRTWPTGASLGADDGPSPPRPPAEEPDLQPLDHRRADDEHDVPRRRNQKQRREDSEDEQQLTELPWGSSDDDDGRADVDVLEQPLRLGHPHADAAVRGRIPDRGSVRSPMDADGRGREPHPTRAEGVPGPGRD